MPVSSFQWVDEPGAVAIDPGSVLVSSFPSAGLAATVAAHWIVRALNLPRVALFDSPDAAPIAVVQSGRVQPPIRVYGRPNFGMVVSEFPPSIAAASAIADAILAAAEQRKARLVVCLEGVVPHPVEETEKAEESVWVVLAREDAKLLTNFHAAGARGLEDGVLGGVTGALLVGGLRRSVPVAALLVSSQGPEGFPDHRAAAALIETLDRFLPELEIDTKPLRAQAEMIERALRAAMRNRPKEAGAPDASPPAVPTMYQ